MIVRPQENWLRMLFVWDGSVLQSIIPQLGFMSLVAVLAVFTNGTLLGEKILLNTTPFTLCGVALTIFLAFRNNASYDRYWEARKLWGNVLIASRTLTSQMICYTPADPAVFARRYFVHCLIAFVYAFKHQLRKTDPGQDIAHYLKPADLAKLTGKHFRPIAILNELRAMLTRQKEAGGISDTQLWMLDHQINELATMVGGCERIASTPIPFAYGVLLHRTVYAYCLLLPFGLVDSIGITTPLVSVFVAYTLLALEAIAAQLADPFGTAPNNLALDAMTRNIERSLLELCDEEVPSEVPVGHRYLLT